MKIYTRAGDDGTTGLIGPGRVPKHSPRVEAYGAVDELNAALGMTAALDRERWIATELSAIQSALFTLGARLATTAPGAETPRLEDDAVAVLERWIDRLDSELPELRRFILPGGTLLAAQLHVARTVCRRAERRVVALEPRDGEAVRYLNRLADLLFVMARWCHRRSGGSEREWHAGAAR